MGCEASYVGRPWEQGLVIRLAETVISGLWPNMQRYSISPNQFRYRIIIRTGCYTYSKSALFGESYVYLEGCGISYVRRLWEQGRMVRGYQ